MDRETVEEIKRHFDQSFEGLKRQFGERFDQVDRRFEQMDRRFEGVDLRFEEMGQLIETKVDDAKRHAGIVAESQDSTIQVLAEGLNHRIDGLTQIVQLTYSELTGRVNDHDKRIGALERRQT